MRKVVIASSVRTPIGDFGGLLQPVKPFDLMMTVMKESLRRAKLEKEDLDQVIVGNCFAPVETKYCPCCLSPHGRSGSCSRPYDQLCLCLSLSGHYFWSQCHRLGSG